MLGKHALLLNYVPSWFLMLDNARLGSWGAGKGLHALSHIKKASQGWEQNGLTSVGICFCGKDLTLLKGASPLPALPFNVMIHDAGKHV